MAERDRVLVIGAGVAGLSCARELVSAGRRVAVLDRARGVGGRCATRRVAEQAVDLGPAFLHGSAPAFLEALLAVPAARVPGWPLAVHGAGRPCQPEAFRAGEQRLAFAEGLSAFPRHLATGLDVHLGARVERLEFRGGTRAVLEGGEVREAGTLVLALAPEQAQRLLEGVADAPPAVRTAHALLDTSRSDPSLALAALYQPDREAPPWHVWYPETSDVLQIVSHDSSKRGAPPFLALVYQARPRWSRQHADDPAWPERMLEEAGRLLGEWALRPAHRHPHRWRYARTDWASELAAPLLLQLEGGGRMGLCGDRFSPGGGIEAAWISGRELARRILAEEVA
ncbi:MAG TPA: FAD-dependent oxidoreductase [Anaeromyxobacteraceae bacterium]|nr:FAD-dependent oxidoreductase [Anaeromyxobacteraceae bacterium]